LEFYLTHGDDKDIDSVDLFNELNILKEFLFGNQRFKKFIEYIDLHIFK